MVRWSRAFVMDLWRRFFARGAAPYSASQKALHWLVVLLCAAQVPTSWAIHRTHQAHGNPDPFDLFLHDVHAWTGWLILAMVCARLLLRLTRGTPPLPSDTPRWARLASSANHFLLYGTLGALPVTGTLAMYVTGRFAPVHELLTQLLLALVIVHVAGALWHLLVRRDRVFTAMLPASGPAMKLQSRKA